MTKGPIVYALQKYDFLVLFPINPSTLAKYREAFTPSRAKDDPTDAELALDLLLRHPDRFQPLAPQSVELRTLASLVEQWGSAPPSAECLEQARREHGIAILLTLALLDAKDHALAVDVTDLEVNHFADPQAGAVGHRQGRPVLEVGHRLQQARHFLDTQDNG